jgi:hypothetical protein
MLKLFYICCCWLYSILKYYGLFVFLSIHCRQRVPIENVSSTSGYYKAVFLKKTQTIIVSFYEYTVYRYIMFWIMMLYDCYYYYCHFLSKYHCFLQCKIRFVLKVIRNPASKSLQSIEISLYLAFTSEWNVAKQENILMNDLFYLEILFCGWKVN